MSKRIPTMLCLAMSLALSAGAEASYRPRDVTVEIIDENGATFQQVPTRHDGKAYRAYLQAERGAHYRIRVSNGTGERVGLVVAVDGRNIISGARSDLANGEPMYILGPRETEEYGGWRTSITDVHEFYFTEWADSYAEAFGDRSARGVIAVAVYKEKESRWLAKDAEQRAGARAGALPAAPSSAVSAAVGSVAQDAATAERSEPGTGYGDRRDEPAVRVAFDAEARASSRVFLKYEWRETLCRKGLLSCEPQNRFWPDDALGFAPPPPRATR